jgi:hypothetical protein
VSQTACGGGEVKSIAALAMSALLGACSAFQVVTFKSSEDSFRRKGERISMAVSGMPESGSQLPDLEKFALRIPGPEGERLRDACGIPQEITPPTGPSASAFAFAGLAVALAGVLIDAGIAKLNEYTDKKIKEFKYTYSGRISVGRFALPKNNAVDQAVQRSRCILFQREVDLSTDAREDPNTRPALIMVFQFQPLGDRAYVLKPIYLDLAYAGARTSAEGNAIDLDVSMGIAIVKQSGGAGLVGDLVAAQSFTIRKVAIRGTMAEKPSYAAKFETGTVIPALGDVTAASIVVAVTETGDGSEEFGQFRKDTDAYGKVLKDFGLEQLKSVLGAK